jgi:hypothetical protein
MKSDFENKVVSRQRLHYNNPEMLQNQLYLMSQGPKVPDQRRMPYVARIYNRLLSCVWADSAIGVLITTFVSSTWRSI